MGVQCRETSYGCVECWKVYTLSMPHLSTCSVRSRLPVVYHQLGHKIWDGIIPEPVWSSEVTALTGT